MTLKEHVLKKKLTSDNICVNHYKGTAILSDTGEKASASYIVILDEELPEDHIVWRMAALALGVKEDCDRCRGTGSDLILGICPRCGGDGTR
jgi:hypothetical protein